MANICLVTAFSDDYTHGYVCWDQNRKYAEKHGYDTRCEIVDVFSMLEQVLFAKRPALSWYKIFLLNKVLAERKHEWVMWIDADAFVMHLEKTFEQVLEEISAKETHQIIVAKDLTQQCRINGGILIFRNTEYSRELLSSLWEAAIARGQDFVTRKFHEQSALEKEFARRFPTIFQRKDPGLSGQWREKGNRGNDTILICDNYHINANSLPCGWIFHGAGKSKSSFCGQNTETDFHKALAKIGYNGDDEEPLLLWRVRPLQFKVDQGFSLEQLAESVEQSPFPFLDLSKLKAYSSSETETFICDHVSRNKRIVHLKISHAKNGTFDLLRILRACQHLETLEVVNCFIPHESAEWLKEFEEYFLSDPNQINSRRLRWLDLSDTLPLEKQESLSQSLEDIGFRVRETIHPILKSENLAKLHTNDENLTIIL